MIRRYSGAGANRMSQTPWRWFPFWLGAAMAVAFAVNGYMVYDALSTFPGVAGQDGFDLSNGYGRIIGAREQQAELGWRIESQVGADRKVVLRLTDRDGAPLKGNIGAVAERPVGPKDSTPLVFHAAVDGRYLTDRTLFSGQWDVLLTVRAGGRVFTATRRILVH